MDSGNIPIDNLINYCEDWTNKNRGNKKKILIYEDLKRLKTTPATLRNAL